ncbi:hypothetical protein BDN71DRAFT_1149174 [Pleurotus eryngii]|uniref:Uncharacterized protein n=1 Tax=Pleurotus eryngii TaxID=5323 RepID=A0A9P5ZSH0_PLEER|nr:hypothetical protein BDN71DRAFT_1149174 [Pleurotus eryngii]
MGADLFTGAKHPPQYAQSAELLDALNSRLLLLSNQFESFMTLTTSLRAQHDAAQPTILNLQTKVVELEDKVKTSQSGLEEVRSASISAATAVVPPPSDAQTPAKSDTEKATLEQLMTDWKRNVDGAACTKSGLRSGPGWPRRGMGGEDKTSRLEARHAKRRE